MFFQPSLSPSPPLASRYPISSPFESRSMTLAELIFERWSQQDDLTQQSYLRNEDEEASDVPTGRRSPPCADQSTT
ncbi:hypothetical protein JCM3766R1_002365 [Sporobolomyces carnicolor]